MRLSLPTTIICLIFASVAVADKKPKTTDEKTNTKTGDDSKTESNASKKDSTPEPDIKSVTVITDKSELKIKSSAPGESFQGLTKKLKGEFEIDIKTFETVEGRIWFPVKSLSTGNSLRDADMRAKPWLHTSKYPKIEFEALELNNRNIRKKDEQIRGKGTIKGKATVRGKSSPTEAEAKIAVLPSKKLVRIKAKMKISLQEHDVPGEGGAIGDKVGKVIDVDALVYGTWE